MASKASKRAWLVKSEPQSFGWDDLLACRRQTTCWDGVRNFQARNFLRDGFALGDLVFFYHSCSKPLAIVGTMRVVRTGYPDPTQPAASEPGSPRTPWIAVDLQALRPCPRPVTLAQLRDEPACAALPLLQRNSRLSVQPIDQGAASAILRLAGLPTALLAQGS